MSQDTEVYASLLKGIVADARKKLEGDRGVGDVVERQQEEIDKYKAFLTNQITVVTQEIVKNNPELLHREYMGVEENVEGYSGKAPPPVKGMLVRSALSGRAAPPVRIREVESSVEDPVKHIHALKINVFLEADPKEFARREAFRERLIILAAMLQVSPEELGKLTLANGYAVDKIFLEFTVFQTNWNNCRTVHLDPGTAKQTLLQYVALVHESEHMPDNPEQDKPADFEREKVIVDVIEEDEDDAVTIPLFWQRSVPMRAVSFTQREEFDQVGTIPGIQVIELASIPSRAFDAVMLSTVQNKKRRRRR